MDIEKEILKLNLMGYTVKTVRTFDGGDYYSLVVHLDSESRVNPNFRASPFKTKTESVHHAVDEFLRFYPPMKKYGHIKY